MQLTRHTDYALRLLIHLAAHEDARLSIAEVAEAQGISRTHLMKIANLLARHDFLKAVRGRGGGIRLARPAEEINLAEVVRATERSCALIDCTGCQLIALCKLPGVLNAAAEAFYAVLATRTLADLVVRRRAIQGGVSWGLEPPQGGVNTRVRTGER